MITLIQKGSPIHRHGDHGGVGWNSASSSEGTEGFFVREVQGRGGPLEVEVREIIFTQGKIKQAEASPTLDSTPEVDADAAPSNL